MDRFTAYEIVMKELEQKHTDLLKRANAGEDVNRHGTELVSVMSYLAMMQAGTQDNIELLVIVE